jgi:hypothetical protein
MPLLDERQIEELLQLAHVHGVCRECGQRTAYDYCRTCDEFYWIHKPGCLMYEPKHYGHRLTIVPFVEDRGAPPQYIVCPKCGRVSHNPNDVERRYCGACHAFHDDMLFAEER